MNRESLVFSVLPKILVVLYEGSQNKQQLKDWLSKSEVKAIMIIFFYIQVITHIN